MTKDIKNEETYKLLMNPTRLRIVQALIRNKELTTSQLSNELPDIAVATLYRQVKALENGELIYIVKENKIRGTIERVYSIKRSPVCNDIPLDQVSQVVNGVFLSLMDNFHNYFNQEKIDPEKDGYFVGTSTLMLSDDEMKTFVQTISTTLDELMKNKADGERKARRITFISSPIEQE